MSKINKENLIVGLDIGSSNVRMVVGKFDQLEDKLRIIAARETVSQGVSKGEINSIEDAVSSVTSILEQVERVVDQPINDLYVGISGFHISSMFSKGVVAVSRADNEITEADIERVIDASQTVATPPNYEIIHVIPKIFTIDNQDNIKDPVGMTGIRLECEVQIIQGLSSQIKNLTKVISRTGTDIKDLVLSVLANAEACLTKKQKDLGCVLINIGHSTTSMAVFEEGDIVSTHVLPIGSSHITNDIAIGLCTSVDVAEEIKLTYGQAVYEDIDKKETINLSEFDESETDTASTRYVAQIIQARLEELFGMVDEKLAEIDRSGMLPAGAILTGGGSKVFGIVNLAKKELSLPAKLGFPREDISSAVDKINDLSFTTAVGLVLWGFEFEKNPINVENPFWGNIFKNDFLINLKGKVTDFFKKVIS